MLEEIVYITRVHLCTWSKSPCVDREEIHWQVCLGYTLRVTTQNGNPADVFASYLHISSMAKYKGRLALKHLSDPLHYCLNF